MTASLLPARTMTPVEEQKYASFLLFLEQVFHGPVGHDSVGVKVDPLFNDISKRYNILGYIGDGKLGVRTLDIKFIESSVRHIMIMGEHNPALRQAIVDWHFNTLVSANPAAENSLYLTNKLMYDLPALVGQDETLRARVLEKGSKAYRDLIVKDPALATDLLSHLYHMTQTNDQSAALIQSSLQALKDYSAAHPEAMDDLLIRTLWSVEQKNLDSVIYKEFSIVPCGRDRHAIVMDRDAHGLGIIFDGKKYDPEDLKQTVFQGMARKFMAGLMKGDDSEIMLRRVAGILPLLQEKMKAAPSLKECVVAPNCHETAKGIPFRWGDFE